MGVSKAGHEGCPKGRRERKFWPEPVLCRFLSVRGRSRLKAYYSLLGALMQQEVDGEEEALVYPWLNRLRREVAMQHVPDFSWIPFADIISGSRKRRGAKSDLGDISNTWRAKVETQSEEAEQQQQQKLHGVTIQRRR